jgi:hypothetical protein
VLNTFAEFRRDIKLREIALAVNSAEGVSKMETWDREQLYSEIWETPLVKLSVKYGISAVALGKICRKLQIPLPGRGYWTKKDFGKPVERVPLPLATNLPVVHRLKTEATPAKSATPRTSEPWGKDPELIRIEEIEAQSFGVDLAAKRHKLVAAAARILRHASVDGREILQPPYSDPCLDIRVSKASLDRALAIVNAIILRLESLKLTVTVERGHERAGVEIDGRRALFVLVEKTRVKSRRAIPQGTWTRTEMEYEPTGQFEFRVGSHGYGCEKKVGDGKTQRLEALLSECVGAILREGRSLRIAAEAARQREIEDQIRREEHRKLRALIDEEEKKVRDLDGWVTNWARAEQIRGFVTALEKMCAEQGHDLSPEAQNGQRILWMKQQADRLDPLVHPSPPSILDRKGELSGW